MNPLTTIACAAVLAVTVSWPGTDNRREPSIDELIKDLGSFHYERRQRASHELLKRESAAPALRESLGSTDLETIRRAQRILAEFRWRNLVRHVASMRAAARVGEVDRVVEFLARRPPHIEEKSCWDVVFNQFTKLREFEKKDHGKIPSSDDTASRTIPPHYLQVPFLITKSRVTSEDLIRTGGLGLIRCELLECKEAPKGPAICSGTAHITNFHRAALLCGDSVSATGLHDTIVVCDGDFEADFVVKSLVIARGKVWVGIARDSTILSARQIVVAYELTKSAAISTAQVKLSKECRRLGNTIKENRPDALGPVKFFDLTAAGLKIETAADGLRIERVTANTPFARAGLRAGDVIRAVDGAKVAGYEPFRRLIRRKLVLEEEAIFRVRRGDATLDLAVRFTK